MKTFKLNTLRLVFSRWQIVVLIQMDPSSSLHLRELPILTGIYLIYECTVVSTMFSCSQILY